MPLLEAVAADQIPDNWRPLTTTTTEEVVLLAPLDIVSARGRASMVFDFEYIWEVYKPAAVRRWGYYTLPILYGDQLVGRLDPRLDRTTATLILNGLWLEDSMLAAQPQFVDALGRGLLRFAAFLHAGRVNLSAIEPPQLRMQMEQCIGARLDIKHDASR